MKKVAIIILNWNGKRDTLECLKSLKKLETGNWKLEVVVVDNGSTDGSVDAFKYLKPQTSNIKLVANKENLGFAQGNNVGIKAALKDGAEYVILLNNDTVVDKNLVNQLIKTFDDYPGVGIISPKIYFAKGFEFHKKRYKRNELGKVIWYAGGKLDWDNVLGSHRCVDEVDRGQHDKVEETDFATGCCMAIKKEVFKKTGLFDKDYFLYLEDVDLCERAKRKGFKVFYTPHAKLWHKVAQSSGIGSDLNDYYLTRNRLLFGSKYASIRSKFALIRESFHLLFSRRTWQKKGVIDYFFGNLGKGSFTWTN